MRFLRNLLRHSEEQVTQWHRWCTQNKHCDWKKNVDNANMDNNSPVTARSDNNSPVTARSDLQPPSVKTSEDRVDEFKAHLFGMFSYAKEEECKK